MTTGEYKRHKGLTKENLRDNMTNVELALNTLADVTATEISRQRLFWTSMQNGLCGGIGIKSNKIAENRVCQNADTPYLFAYSRLSKISFKTKT